MKIIFISTAILLFVINVKGQNINRDQESEVKKVITNVYEGISAIDINNIRRYCTKDMLTVSNGTVWNLDSIAKNMIKPALKVVRTNEFKFVKLQISGNTAWAIYYMTTHLIINDSKRPDTYWLNSAVLINEDNHWLISQLTSNMIYSTY